jgi:hypothetical protein
MYADFHRTCLYTYTHDVRKLVDQDKQYLGLMRTLQVVQPEQMAQRHRRTTMELQEQIPTITEVRNLEHVGFSSEQIASLFTIKALYQRGAYHEATSEFKRLAFIRWLYQHGRLQS